MIASFSILSTSTSLPGLPHRLWAAGIRPLRIAAWIVALPWIARLFEAAWGLPQVTDILNAPWDRTPEGLPRLAVIVPARNEQGAIQACLTSLLQQDYANLHIFAVDDRSTDSTGSIMDALAAQHPGHLTAVHVTHLPEGWLGKSNAMAITARAAIADLQPEYLLFTDGDILFAPSILRRSLAYMQSTGADHLVTLPTTLTHTAGESALLAMLHVVSLFAVRAWRVANPRSRDSVGVGAFNMLRTQTYLAVGGVEAAPLEVVEDLALGRRIKRAGYRQHAVYAPSAVTVHWAPGLLGVLHGMTKNFFAIFRFNPLLLLAASIGTAAFWIAPWVFLAIPGCRLPAALTLLALAGLYTLAGRRSLLSPLWCLTAPIAAALLIYSMLRSMLITLRDGGVTWRGTFYPLATLRSRMKPL